MNRQLHQPPEWLHCRGCVLSYSYEPPLLDNMPLDVATLAPVYDRLHGWNFSNGFLSQIPEHLVVMRADDLGWSDWGTPEAIERSFATMGVVPPWRGRVGPA